MAPPQRGAPAQGGRSSHTVIANSESTKKRKAKHEWNQDAVDRLHELMLNAEGTTHKIFAIRKAIKAVAEATEPIESRRDAMKLKGVGEHYARIIVPATAADVGSATMSSNLLPARRPLPEPGVHKPTSRKRKAKDSEQIEVDKPSAKTIAYRKAKAEAEGLTLPTEGWKVILLLDGREKRHDRIQAKLQMSSVPCEVRHLPIGDMAWIARSGNIEVMLGTIVERKAVDDLRSSIFGSRYLEQRLRLSNCGMAQVLLLVEGDVNQVEGCPPDTLRYAMMETRVQLDFQIYQTENGSETVKFLKTVHRRVLQRTFPSAFGAEQPTSLPSFLSPTERRRVRKKKKISLIDMTFDSPPVPPLKQQRFITYDELKAKVEMDREQGTKRMSSVYCGMLKQIPSVSHNKVYAINQAYPSMDHLMRAYASCDDPKTLITDLETNATSDRQCRVGPKSAKEVYHTFTEGASVAFVVQTSPVKKEKKGEEGRIRPEATQNRVKAKIQPSLKTPPPKEKPPPRRQEEKGAGSYVSRSTRRVPVAPRRGRTINARIGSPLDLNSASYSSSFLTASSPTHASMPSIGARLGGGSHLWEDSSDDDDLQRAIRAGLDEEKSTSERPKATTAEDSDDDDDLRRAIRLNLEGSTKPAASTPSSQDSLETPISLDRKEKAKRAADAAAARMNQTMAGMKKPAAVRSVSLSDSDDSPNMPWSKIRPREKVIELD